MSKLEEFQVAVAYNKLYTWQPVAVAPDTVFVSNRDDFDDVRWTLTTGASGVGIDSIVVLDGNGQPFDLFQQLGPVPGTNNTQWLGKKPKANKDGAFKYVVTVDGTSLDPVLVAGQRP